MTSILRHLYDAPPRKPRRNPFSRARAKRWFARTNPDLKILRYDGKKTFVVDPRRCVLDMITGEIIVFHASFSERFGEFLFTTDPEG